MFRRRVRRRDELVRAAVASSRTRAAHAAVRHTTRMDNAEGVRGCSAHAHGARAEGRRRAPPARSTEVGEPAARAGTASAEGDVPRSRRAPRDRTRGGEKAPRAPTVPWSCVRVRGRVPRRAGSAARARLAGDRVRRATRPPRLRDRAAACDSAASGRRGHIRTPMRARGAAVAAGAGGHARVLMAPPRAATEAEMRRDAAAGHRPRALATKRRAPARRAHAAAARTSGAARRPAAVRAMLASRARTGEQPLDDNGARAIAALARRARGRARAIAELGAGLRRSRRGGARCTRAAHRPSRAWRRAPELARTPRAHRGPIWRARAAADSLGRSGERRSIVQERAAVEAELHASMRQDQARLSASLRHARARGARDAAASSGRARATRSRAARVPLRRCSARARAA